MGVILAILRISGNIPTVKDKLTNLESQDAKKGLSIFKIKTGILLGPVDFFISKASINFSISAGTVGERKNEALDGTNG